MRRFICIAIAVAAVAALFATQGANPALSSANRNFRAHLTGDQEVQTPPVETQAQGQALFQLSKDGKTLHYKLIVANIANVTQAHIHLAPAGANGPVVAFLFHGPTTNGRFDGVLAQGAITSANLVGPLTGQPLSALINAVSAGNTYVNVHTTAYPAGEIRGQIR